MMNTTTTGLHDVRRQQRVARKAGMNIGANGANGGNMQNHVANLAAVYAPMVVVDNQNMLNTI